MEKFYLPRGFLSSRVVSFTSSSISFKFPRNFLRFLSTFQSLPFPFGKFGTFPARNLGQTVRIYWEEQIEGANWSCILKFYLVRFCPVCKFPTRFPHFPSLSLLICDFGAFCLLVSQIAHFSSVTLPYSISVHSVCCLQYEISLHILHWGKISNILFSEYRVDLRFLLFSSFYLEQRALHLFVVIVNLSNAFWTFLFYFIFSIAKREINAPSSLYVNWSC